MSYLSQSAVGYTVEDSQSAALTNIYPALYREMQVINWCSIDVVVTERDGSQSLLPRCPNPVNDGFACVRIEMRKHNGMRIDMNQSVPNSSTAALQLPTKRTSIYFRDFNNAPIRVEEFGIILSTVEQATIAKDMVCGEKYPSMIYETRVDANMIDPRIVLQVIDPNNQWDCLYVNVLGTTVVLRSGRYNQIIPSAIPTTTPNPHESGKLIGYLRYPTEYYVGCQTKQFVFEISLDELYKKEPYRLSSGDYICIAENMYDLQEVMNKKANQCGGIHANCASDKMVPKEMYEAAEKNHQLEIDQLNETHKNVLNSATTKLKSDLEDTKAKLQTALREKDAAEAKCKQWEAMHEAATSFDTQQSKADAEREKVRKEQYENSRRDIENMWTMMKIGGTVLAAVSSFAITMLIKSKK